MISPDFLIICALVGAVLNRFSGFTNIRWLPGRNIYYAALALFLLALAVFDLGWAAVLCVGALTYRVPGWQQSLDMGTVGQTLTRDALVMFGRGFYFAPPFIYAVVAYHVSAFYALALLTLGSLGAVLSYYLGTHTKVFPLKDPFVGIEALAGASLGLSFALVYQAGH